MSDIVETDPDDSAAGARASLDLVVDAREGRRRIEFPVRRLVCAGWSGRNKDLQAHIDEMAQLGIPGPKRTPIYLNLSPYLATTSSAIEVIGAETSGEVEYVLLKTGTDTYVGVGSDQTDRALEQFSIPASKQMYAKVISPLVWPYEEVAQQWDELMIRSWTTIAGERTLYQEDTLAAILDPHTLLERLPRDDDLGNDDIVMFSGTISSKTGLLFGERFDVELVDPILERKLTHGYRIQVLPQYL